MEQKDNQNTKLDLDVLKQKLDNALEKETEESLKEILSKFDEYYATASEEEIKEGVDKINKMFRSDNNFNIHKWRFIVKCLLVLSTIVLIIKYWDNNPALIAWILVCGHEFNDLLYSLKKYINSK